MILAVLSLLVPTAILHCGIAPRTARHVSALAFTFGQAMLLAIGITSCLWFVWLQTFGGAGRAYAVFELSTLIAAAAALRRLSATESVDPMSGGRTVHAPVAAGPVARYAAGVVAVLTAAWIVSFLCNTSLHPDGSWDAVSIWNLAARFLAGGGEGWRDFIHHADVCAFHGDYPLLLPSAVARLWNVAGTTAPGIGALVAFWFAAATILLCAGIVGCMRGTTQALLAAAALLGTGDFIEQSSSQYADIPLAAYMLAAASALVLCDEGEQPSPRWLLLAGAAAGFAAWTKNEGLIFAAAVIGVRLFSRRSRPPQPARLASVAPLAAAMALPVSIVGYFKAGLAPRNDLVAGQGMAATLARLFTPDRYLTIAVGLSENLLATAKALLFALPIYFLLMGRTRTARGQAGIRSVVALYGLMFVGYCGVYLVTPLPLAWHLETSARRVLLQLWPGCLMAFFLAVAAPEERFGRSAGDADVRATRRAVRTA